MTRPLTTLLLAATLLFSSGCRQDMHDQAKLEPFEASSYFEDGRASRPLIAGTIARGHLHDDALLFDGKEDGVAAKRFPFPVTADVIERGHERYDIYCAPCHDRAGNGRGMVVERGFPQPNSLHAPRLHAAPAGYFYAIIKNGFARMPSYASQIDAKDRWAIIAYIRALQLSRNVNISELTEGERNRLETAGG